MTSAEDITDALDHDSFLDIVANIVGILIILIVVVSVRARNAPRLAIQAQQAAPNLSARQSEAIALSREAVRARDAMHSLLGVVGQRKQEREYLAVLIANLKQQLEERKDSLTSQSRQTLELKAKLRDAEARLAALLQQEVQADKEAEANTVVEIKSLATPISQAVYGSEIHFHLKSGQIAYVPIDELFAVARLQAREKLWKLDTDGEVTEMVGPQDGFRMRYTLEKLRITREQLAEAGGPGFIIRSKHWEMIPTSGQLGEPVQVALRGGSDFRRRLARYNPKETTVTLWTYADSFEAFRQLKDELHRLGFSIAGRPLPEGISIGGSPHGTRSEAQ